MSRVYWTEERIAASIRAWADDHHGVPPSCITWRHAGYDHPSFVTVIERFGTFTAALEAAGFVPHHVRRTVWPRERIIEALQLFHAEHGRPPRFEEWRRATPFTPNGSTVQQAFGSWNDALAAAGLDSRPKRDWWSRERIIECLLDHAAAHGRMPTSVEWHRGGEGRPNASTVIRRFGSWAAAVKAAREGAQLKLYVDASPFVASVRSYVSGDRGSYQLLGELAGVDETIIGRIARGQKKLLHLDTAEALATALDRPDLLVAA